MTMTFFSGVAGFFLVLAVFLQTGFGLSPLAIGPHHGAVPARRADRLDRFGAARQPLAAPADRCRRAAADRRHGDTALGRRRCRRSHRSLALRAAAVPVRPRHGRGHRAAVPDRRCRRCRRATRAQPPAPCSRSSRSAARSALPSPARSSFPRSKADSPPDGGRIRPSSTACRLHCSTRWWPLPWLSSWCSSSGRRRSATKPAMARPQRRPAPVEA